MGRTWRRGPWRRAVSARSAAPRGGGVVVAASLALVALTAIVAALGSDARWVFEAIAATGVVVGVGAALGVLDRERLRRWRGRRRSIAGPEVAAELTAAVLDQLDALDPVEHRLIGLGAPWPTVIVGPTGVIVVAVTGASPCPAVGRLSEVLGLAADVAASLPGSRTVEVRGVLVVPDGAAREPCADGVRHVRPDELGDAIARGHLLPMATVKVLYARLSGVVAPERRLDAV